MAKKYNKAPKPLSIPKEYRYPRGISLEAIAYLTKYIPITLAIRLLSLIYIAAGMDNKKVATLVNCSTKTVRSLRKKMDTEEVSELLHIKKGSGRKPKSPAPVELCLGYFSC